MQKLTIPTLIFLLLAAVLSAEDDREILMDKEILYWRPQGADIPLPEVFFSPPMIFYPYGAWKTDLSPVFEISEDEIPPERAGTEEISFSSPGWEPPGLSLNGEDKSRRNRLRLYASKPYGTGIQAAGDGGNFGYELEANGSVDEDYPHWGRLSFNGKPGAFGFSMEAGVRNIDELRMLSLLEAEASFGSEDAGQSLAMRWKSDSAERNDESANTSWGALGAWDVNLFSGDSLGLDAGLEGDCLREMSCYSWRITPELLLHSTRSLTGGDLDIKGGLLTDLYPGEPGDSAYFPTLTLLFRRYSEFSIAVKYTNESMDEKALLGFLLKEPPVSGDFGFYRWHRGSLSWAGRIGSGRASFEGGVRFGEMPQLDDGLLAPDGALVLFSKAEWTQPAGKGMVTEFTLFADYEDRGSFRFLLTGGWVFNRPDGRIYALTLRGGDRLIVRGYETVLNDSSDLLTGAGGAAEFSPLLKLEGNLDYVPRKGEWEGALSLVFRY